MIESRLGSERAAANRFRFGRQAGLAGAIAALILFALINGRDHRSINIPIQPTRVAKGGHNTSLGNPKVSVPVVHPTTVIRPPLEVVTAEQHKNLRNVRRERRVRIAKTYLDTRPIAPRVKRSLASVDGGKAWHPTAADYVMPDSMITSGPIEATYVSGESVGGATATEAQGW